MNEHMIDWPGEVRQQVLAQHEGLRRMLQVLEDDVRAASDPALGATLAARWRELRAALDAHMAYEDAVLKPALEEIDAWGMDRAEQVLDTHARQRERLNQLDRVFLPTVTHQARLDALLGIIGELRMDMAHEERTQLRADVLRDDVVAIGQAGG